MRLALVALVLAAILAATAACGGAPNAPIDRNSAPVADGTAIVGALPAEGRVLQRLLRELGPTRIRRIGVKPVRRPARRRLPPDAVTITVSAGESLRGRWEAYLAVGRYTAEAWRLHLRKPGRLSVGGGSTGARAIPASTFRIDLASARNVLRRASARLVEVRRPFGALVLTVRTSEPAVFLKYGAERFLKALGSRPSTYWAVEDAHGAVVYAGGTLTSGVGMMAARADLDSCGPIHHTGLFGYEPPPCPA
jgi:hypothetical protein